jgi:hypothetical protein
MVGILDNLIVPKAEYPPAALCKERCALGVSLTFGMLAAVCLNNEPRFDAREIGKRGWDRMLPAKLPSVDSMIAQLLPQLPFRESRIESKFAGATHGFFLGLRHWVDC